MRKTLNKILWVGVCLFMVGFLYLSDDPHGSRTVISENVKQVPPIETVTTDAVVYTDNFNGANDTNALKARGYKVWYRGTGPQGPVATWFQGNSTVFAAYEGPSTGYVAANYQIVTNVNNIDSWLVLPKLSGGVASGDTLRFWTRSPDGSTWPDSIRVMVSANDSVPEGSWTELGRFKTITTAWQQKIFVNTLSSPNGRYAIRYCVVNGGPNGQNSDYIGIDLLQVTRSAGGQLNQPDEWCNIPPGIPGSGAIWGHASVAYGDTLYVQGDGAATATTMFRKYSISSNTWTTGTPLPGPKSGGDLVACGGKIYYVGGGSSVTVGTPEQYVYNPATGTWTTIANIPFARTGCVGESYQDSLIYVISGGWSTYSTTVSVYSVGSNTWATATSMPSGTGRRSFAGGLWGNKIFVCAGYSATFRQDLQIGTINPSNPLLITWAAGPTFSVATSRPGGTAIEGRFYIAVGELSGGGAGNQMGRFDITGNAWLSVVTPKPTPTSNLWGAVSGSYVNCSGRLGIKIWVPGGSLSNTNRPLDVFADTCLFPCGVITGGVTQNNNNQIPETYVLNQNYPNPFNPSTKISYLLPKASDVKIVVFDLLGREVTTLVNEFKPAGTHTVEFNAVNLASGLYLYRIEAGDFTATKKMLLVK